MHMCIYTYTALASAYAFAPEFFSVYVLGVFFLLSTGFVHANLHPSRSHVLRGVVGAYEFDAEAFGCCSSCQCHVRLRSVAALCVVLQCIVLCLSALFASAISYETTICCSVLQRVAVRCCVLQCVAVRCSSRRCHMRLCSVATCCSKLQHVAACCSVLQCLSLCCGALSDETTICCSVLQRVAACCSVVQRVAVCCSVLQRVLRHVVACCSVLQCVAVPYSPRPCHARL